MGVEAQSACQLLAPPAEQGPAMPRVNDGPAPCGPEPWSGERGNRETHRTDAATTPWPVALADGVLEVLASGTAALKAIGAQAPDHPGSTTTLGVNRQHGKNGRQ